MHKRWYKQPANCALLLSSLSQTSLWIMASRADTIQIAWTNTATWSAAILLNQPVNTFWTKVTLPPYTPTADGTYQLQINMAGAQAGTVFNIDDVVTTNGPCYIPNELELKQAWWKQVWIPAYTTVSRPTKQRPPKQRRKKQQSRVRPCRVLSTFCCCKTTAQQF